MWTSESQAHSEFILPSTSTVTGGRAMFRLNNRAVCPHSTSRPYGHCSAFRLLVRSPPIMRGIPFLLSFGSITNHKYLSSHSLFCFSENSVFVMRQLRVKTMFYSRKIALRSRGTLQDKMIRHNQRLPSCDIP